MTPTPIVTSELDHIVIIAATLEEGVEYCERMLGVRPEVGGAHPRMGTHNCVAALGEQTYLEVIAVDPDAEAPLIPRWFGMDGRVDGPRLGTFVARTNDIDAAAKILPLLGPVCPMERADLRWRITIPEDGGLVEHGCIPSLIQWQDGMLHPTVRMPDRGNRLASLTVCHPQPARLAAQWNTIGLPAIGKLDLQQAAPGQAPSLILRVTTPLGIRSISSGPRNTAR